MQFSAVLLAVVAATTTVLASPLHSRFSPYAIKDSHKVPPRWSNIGSAPPDHVIKLHIGLKQSRFGELERQLHEGMKSSYSFMAAADISVSNPSHARYGQHLTIDEVNRLVQPADDTLDLVLDWLHEKNIPSDLLEYSPAQDWIKVSLPVEEVEQLLDTKYSVYRHEDGDHLVRAPVWSLPAHLHNHVDTIQPTNSFFRPRGRRMTYKTVIPMEKLAQRPAYTFPSMNGTMPSNMTLAAACNTSAVTPTCLRTLYGTIDYKPQVPDKLSVGLTDFLGEANNRSDVGIFLEKFRPDAVSAADTFTVDVINGGDDQQTPDTPTQLAAGKDLEGNLDAETIIGFDYPIPLTAFSTGGMPPFVPDLATRKLDLKPCH